MALQVGWASMECGHHGSHGSSTSLRAPALAGEAAHSPDGPPLWPIAQQTLLCGGNVYVHCVAGRHCGATVAALMHSLISGQPFGESVQHISGLRDVQIEKVLRESGVEACIMGERHPSHGPDRSDVPPATGLHRNQPLEHARRCRRRGAFVPTLPRRAAGVKPPQERLLRRNPARGTDCMRRAPASWHPR